VGAEFVQTAFRVMDELHAKPVFRFSPLDLVMAILAEFFGDGAFPARELANQREDRGISGTRDRCISLAVQDDIHRRIARRLLVIPEFSVNRAASLNADHSSALHS